MPRKIPELTFQTNHKDFTTVDEALLEASRTSLLVVGGKFTTILVYATTERAAMRWGGEHALEMFRANAAACSAKQEPLATVQVKAQPSYWR